MHTVFLNVYSCYYEFTLYTVTYFLYFVLFLHLRPPVLKISGAISMLELRQLLPRAVFETCFSGEGVLLEKKKKQLYYTEVTFSRDIST